MEYGFYNTPLAYLAWWRFDVPIRSVLPQARTLPFSFIFNDPPTRESPWIDGFDLLHQFRLLLDIDALRFLSDELPGPYDVREANFWPFSILRFVSNKGWDFFLRAWCTDINLSHVTDQICHTLKSLRHWYEWTLVVLCWVILSHS